LVRRYGPGVLRVCRRALGNGQDADDAFQATFVVLVLRGGQSDRIDDLGRWLRGVARRVAARSRMRAQRRNTRETTVVDVRDLSAPVGPDVDDIPPLLRSEVERLPEKFRRPIELCYWEGLTGEEAAARLGCPTGTLKWRLTRARETLRRRLSHLGLALAAILWLRPIVGNAAESRRSESGGVGSGSTGGNAGGGDGMPFDLVARTIALAEFVRDFPLALLNFDPGANPPRKGRRRRLPGFFLALLAAGLITGMVMTVTVLKAARAVPAEQLPQTPRVNSGIEESAVGPIQPDKSNDGDSPVRACH
jgi:RNA polymerase sigma factor (sigma-70 family)